MDEEKDVEHQLDELFNGDFIEIDGNSANNIIEKKEKKESLNSNSNISYVDSIKEEKVKTVENKFTDNNTSDETNEKVELKKEIIKETSNIKKKTKKEKIKKVKAKKEKIKKSFKFNSKIFIMCSGAIVVLILVILIAFNFFKEKTYVCKLNIKDTGYEITDKYEITVQKGHIKRIISNYNYMALNDEFKEQVEFVKQEKLPVIINSNGMPGFTYIFEEETYKFSVTGYLDFVAMKDLNSVKKRKLDIAYFNIKKKLRYKELKKELIEKGYICK